jgi:hypothetical protein
MEVITDEVEDPISNTHIQIAFQSIELEEILNRDVRQVMRLQLLHIDESMYDIL